MALKNYLFTSESVSEGHPDKMCDQISDAVLDAYLAQDPHSRVPCETLVKTGVVFVAGEITSKAFVNVAPLVRDVVLNIGYDHSDKGFDGTTCAVQIALEAQLREGVASRHQQSAMQSQKLGADQAARMMQQTRQEQRP